MASVWPLSWPVSPNQAERTEIILNRLSGISEAAAVAASWPLVWPDEWAISSGGTKMRNAGTWL
jgi:hypothetical protein